MMSSNGNYVLLTGATGSLGRDLITYAKRHSNILIPLTRDNTNFYCLPTLPPKTVSVDLIHLGSTTPANEIRNSADYSLNYSQLHSLISQLSGSYFINKVIFASSMSVYGKPHETPIIDENAPKTLSNLYGLSKLRCEEFLSKAYTARQIKSFICLRLPGLLASHSASRSKNFLSCVYRDMRLNKDVTVSNPDFLFNNIISSRALSRYIHSLLSADSLPCCSVNLASNPPVRLSVVIDYIAFKCNYTGQIDWVQSAQAPFGISTALAERFGFKAPTVFESIDHVDNHDL